MNAQQSVPVCPNHTWLMVTSVMSFFLMPIVVWCLTTALFFSATNGDSFTDFLFVASRPLVLGFSGPFVTIYFLGFGLLARHFLLAFARGEEIDRGGLCFITGTTIRPFLFLFHVVRNRERFEQVWAVNMDRILKEERAGEIHEAMDMLIKLAGRISLNDPAFNAVVFQRLMQSRALLDRTPHSEVKSARLLLPLLFAVRTLSFLFPTISEPNVAMLRGCDDSDERSRLAYMELRSYLSELGGIAPPN